MIALSRISDAYDWNRIEITAFDIDESWVLSQNLVRNFVCVEDVDIAISLHEFDLCSDELEETAAEACAEADLIVFQNVLNEIEDRDAFVDLFRTIAETMDERAELLVSDVAMTSNYKLARRLHPLLAPGRLQRFEGEPREISRTAAALAQLTTPAAWERLTSIDSVRTRLELLLGHCPTVLSNAHSPYKYNYLYYVKESDAS